MDPIVDGSASGTQAETEPRLAARPGGTATLGTDPFATLDRDPRHAIGDRWVAVAEMRNVTDQAHAGSTLIVDRARACQVLSFLLDAASRAAVLQHPETCRMPLSLILVRIARRFLRGLIGNVGARRPMAPVSRCPAPHGWQMSAIAVPVAVADTCPGPDRCRGPGSCP